MAVPLLTNLPTSPYASVYGLVVSMLRDDPVLRSARVNVVGLETADDGSPIVAPIPANDRMPMIRVSFAGFPNRQFAEGGGHRPHMTIVLELFAAGTHPADILNLYHAAYRVFFPDDRAAQQAINRAFNDLHVTGGEWKTGAQDLRPQGSNRCMRAVANLEFRFLILGGS